MNAYLQAKSPNGAEEMITQWKTIVEENAEQMNTEYCEWLLGNFEGMCDTPDAFCEELKEHPEEVEVLCQVFSKYIEK